MSSICAAVVSLTAIIRIEALLPATIYPARKGIAWNDTLSFVVTLVADALP
jgi:hypothetical protein